MNICWTIFFCALCQPCICQADNEISQLALIALKTSDSEYKIPKCVKKNFLNKTVYYLPDESTQMVYFCPKFHRNYLLYPSKNKQCEAEPTPSIRRASDDESQITECANQEGKYSLYTYGYQVAHKNDFEETKEHEWDDWLNVYSFCFDHKKQDVLYFSYQIISPSLLTSDSLEQERLYLGKKYKFYNFGDSVLGKYTHLIYERYNEHDKKFADEQQAMIASPFDMAFAIWKKPFTHIINYAYFSHVFKAVQWVKITIFIRNLAIQGWGELHIKVGRMNHRIGNHYYIWWKLVITQDETHAIVIILHDIGLHEKTPFKDFTCQTTCAELGFEEMVDTVTELVLYCCDPEIIRKHVPGLKPYRLLNLRSELVNAAKPPKVDCGSTSRRTSDTDD